ncbi:MAG: NAD(P)H-binding protein [Patescibacteria group bacterium]|nr:NAD(P)H-binding protein [Patescibacteria group bacterium]MDE1943990.1 NAD(P)H-binding protein [Patescibacteria group bacterium]MDE1945060.1 NAD(P)H-binding protein [Patescibacteria group bacterium]MDE2057704.1 NAD(P)H-binding protein [Patescibacteria group bacterium]
MMVFVTGAGGMVGQALVRLLLERGHQVVAQVRSPHRIELDHPLLAYRVGDMRDAVFLSSAVAGADYVVHLAAAKADEPESYATNVDGMRHLVRACQEARVRAVVNLSTLSTRLAKQGRYARTKNEADRLLEASSIPHVTLRSSVIYDATGRGIIGTLVRYTRLPVVPVIGSGRARYEPIHVDDVAQTIEAILARGVRESGAYDLGGPETLSFDDLVRCVARELYGRRPRLVHIPLPIASAVARVSSLVLARPPITMSNVFGAAEDVRVDTEPLRAAYGLHPRFLVEGLRELRQEWVRHATEPYRLLRYVSHERPPDALAERYARACAFYALTDPIDPFVLKSLRRIGALDAITKFVRPHGVFQRKVAIAAALYECSPVSSAVLLPSDMRILPLLGQLALLGLHAGARLLYGVCLLRYA